jgi:hypothetical protein
VAITHNPAFAAALRPTHVLRVSGGSAKLSEHRGELSPKDFDHKPTTSSSSSGNGKGSSNGSNGKVAGVGSSTKKVSARQNMWKLLLLVVDLLGF